MIEFQIGQGLLIVVVNIVGVLKTYFIGVVLAFLLTLTCDIIYKRRLRANRLIPYALLSYFTLMYFLYECAQDLWRKISRIK